MGCASPLGPSVQSMLGGAVPQTAWFASSAIVRRRLLCGETASRSRPSSAGKLKHDCGLTSPQPDAEQASQRLGKRHSSAAFANLSSKRPTGPLPRRGSLMKLGAGEQSSLLWICSGRIAIAIRALRAARDRWVGRLKATSLEGVHAGWSLSGRRAAQSAGRSDSDSRL